MVSPGEGGLYLAILILLAIAGIFTIGGGEDDFDNKNFPQYSITGLSAVIWTDFVQTILMILGAFVLMITAMVRLVFQRQIKVFTPFFGWCH